MTQEEKLEEAKRLYQTANADQRYVLESLFPELAESEDDRIRKSIIEHLQSDIDDMSKSDCPFDFEAEIEELSKYIAWLEKQAPKPQGKTALEAIKEEKLNNANYCSDCTNKRGCINCENGELKETEQASKWSEEDEKCIDNCCLLIGAADNCYEKTFKDDCIHYLQNLKKRMGV